MNKPKSMWSDLPRRLATICIGFPLVWTMLSHSIASRIFFMGAQGLSLWEFTLLEPKDTTTAKNQSMSSSTRPVARLMYCVISVALATLTAEDDTLFQMLLCGLSGGLVWLDERHWILGLIVVTLPFRMWIWLAPQDFPSTISVLLVVWNCDTGALIFGRISSKFGLPRLPVPAWIHRISPAKSMEGFLGGILGGAWTAVSWIPLLIRKTSMETSSEFNELWGSFHSRLVLGVALSCLAIIGDLVESSIKRQSQSKDSGSILPGHGGILDRFDSSLLAILLYSWCLRGSMTI